ncbi:hypothetical protein Glove_55g62 [Diversispora epigaea]|uniref:Uncharacterized protein n=1 Tax=Diversispora epigaea TaxID=1348612 RepID=A0A397JNH9_9GLOM|nr:hypothetical protein Glove_55g62 [Diversispora epigaea]
MIIQSEQSTSISPPTTNVINLTDFRNPQIPNTDGLVKSVELVFENFKKFSNDKKNENHHIEKILKQAHEFDLLVKNSVQQSKQVAEFSRIFVEYIQTTTEDDVSGTDFIEVMKSQIQCAMKNKSDIEDVTKGYSEILTILVNLVWDLEDHTSQTNIEQLLSEDVNRARKEQKTRKFAALGSGITTGVALCAAPFTAGASLAILGVLGITSAGALIGTSVSGVKRGERANQLESKLNQINQIREYIEIVMKELTIIIDKHNGFIEIFKSAIDDIEKITEKYSADAENVNFRMTKIKYLSIKNQWARVNEVFQAYSDELQRMLPQ